MKLSVATLALFALGAMLPSLDRPAKAPEVDLVTVPAGAWTFRPSGAWHQAGRQVDPPLLRLQAEAPLVIMRHQVSRGDYAACVADGVCLPAETGPADEPQTGVSWHDAQAYAAWPSDRTGDTWRLPTDAEWQRAAAERFTDDALGDDSLTERWLARYERESETEIDPALRAKGGWGENSLGLADLAGNVWEWTDDCVVTGTIGLDGVMAGRDEFCGARIVEGAHRAVVIDFVRDARAGGCASGVPPEHLGFRLVRED